MENPLVSVILPCYNAQQFLPDALDSIIAQTYRNLEIICINDGSDDNTPEILESYAQKDTRIRVIHNETNIKLIRTLNKGIDLAKGEYIARMDADDISLRKRIETEYNFLKSNPEIDIISCGIKYINEKGKFIREYQWVNSNPTSTFFASFFYTPIAHAPLLGKTSVFKKFKYSLESNAIHTEDSELWGRMLLNGIKLNTIKKSLYLVRINQESVSYKFNSIQNQNFVKSCQIRLNSYFQLNISHRETKFLCNRIPQDATYKEFKAAIKQFHMLLFKFLEKEKVTETTSIHSVKCVYYSHLFDICFQAIKRAKLNKFKILHNLINKPQILFYPCVWKFLIRKIKI